jgi:hypothetical protein
LRWSRFVDMWETPEFFMLFLERDSVGARIVNCISVGGRQSQ